MKRLCFVPLCMVVSLSATAFAQDDDEDTSTKKDDWVESSDEDEEEEEAEPVVEKKKKKKKEADSEEAEEVKKVELVDEYPLKRFSITANPLSLAVLRFSVNFEYLFAKHHGLIVVPSFWTLGGKSGDVETNNIYVGGEVGYHFYSGQRGANGFFAGPSLVYMYFKSSASDGESGYSRSNHLMGFAVDVGGQHITRGGFTVGGGMGLMWAKMLSSEDGAGEGQKFSITGVLPRFLATIGYSF